jgi:SOS-response transcriptional repressor LexA
MTLAATSSARYAILAAHVLGEGNTPAGILLEDSREDKLYIRLRKDWEEIADEEEAEVLSLLEDDLNAKASEMGAGKLLAWLEENASGSITIDDPESVLVEDFPRALNRLYRRHVPSKVRPFITHLPRYSLRAAAGKFLENDAVSDQGWEEAPAGLHLLPDMFVAEIVGHSMEPLIPDCSLCVFRAGVVGSRTGRLVLAEDRQMTGNDRYAVKRYRSGMKQGEKTVRLESLNPAYPSWDLDPDEDKYAIIAEFIRVLD